VNVAQQEIGLLTYKQSALVVCNRTDKHPCRSLEMFSSRPNLSFSMERNRHPWGWHLMHRRRFLIFRLTNSLPEKEVEELCRKNSALVHVPGSEAL
jgi:hypothetical protein